MPKGDVDKLIFYIFYTIDIFTTFRLKNSTDKFALAVLSAQNGSSLYIFYTVDIFTTFRLKTSTDKFALAVLSAQNGSSCGDKFSIPWKRLPVYEVYEI